MKSKKSKSSQTPVMPNPLESISPATHQLMNVIRKDQEAAAAEPVLDMRVNMQDLRNMAVVEIRRGIMAAREQVQEQLNELRTETDQLSRDLVRLANELVAGIDFAEREPSLHQLCELMNKVTEEKLIRKDASDIYHLHFVKAGSSFTNYSHYNNSGRIADQLRATDARPVVDAERRKITGELQLISYSRGNLDEFDIPYSVDFTPEMIDLLTIIRSNQQQIAEASQSLSRITRQLAELPNHGDAIQSMLTRAQLTGDLRTPGDVVGVLDACCKKLQLTVASNLKFKELPCPMNHS